MRLSIEEQYGGGVHTRVNERQHTDIVHNCHTYLQGPKREESMKESRLNNGSKSKVKKRSVLVQ